MRILAGLLSFTVLALATSALADVVHIKIDGLAYVPPQATARVGDTVEWTNDDFVDHTATSATGEWDVSVPAGATGRVVVTRAGTLRYYCRYHPNMRGELRVQAK